MTQSDLNTKTQNLLIILAEELQKLSSILEQSNEKNFTITIKHQEPKKAKRIKATLEEHIHYYKIFHSQRVKEFLSGEIDRPSQAQSIEEPYVRELMRKNGKTQDRDTFYQARNKCLHYIEKRFGPGELRKIPSDTETELRAFLKTKHNY